MIEQPTGIIIADSGPLIHLDELDCLDLLNDFKQIMVHDAVWREVQVHRPASLQSSILNELEDASSDKSIKTFLKSIMNGVSNERVCIYKKVFCLP